ncbi:MAG: ABC transporter permease [Solobacterium sp.]|nr:ABC transporter permease [Solobacterium sp.]
MVKMIQEIYAYREMLVSLVHRDLRGRYKGSALGFLWTFINPLLQLGVYTVVFSVILRNGIQDFYLFLFVALIPWLFFSGCLTGGAGCIRAQGDMVKKIYFPREIIPLSFVVSQFINMVLSLIVVIVVLLIAGKGINLVAFLYLPLIMIIEFLIALGMTMLLSGVTVYFRDTEYFIGIIAMLWQFLTPIMYGLDVVPERLLSIFFLNPMTPVIIAYRDILYYKQVPQLSTLILALVFGVVMVVVGVLTFGHLKKHFAEEL